jgi:hypothetical protein
MTTALNSRVIFIVLIITLAFGFIATSVLAQKPEINTKPGWGFGDTNHVHLGPPGQSVSVLPGNNTIIQNNNVSVNNNVNVSSNTGNNTSNGGNILTGISQTFVTIFNVFGFNNT